MLSWPINLMSFDLPEAYGGQRGTTRHFTNAPGVMPMPQDFQEQLIPFLPKMRIWALALTRNRAAAEDLTQDVATKALVARDCFIPGTNFSAWVHSIMVNHFISSVRSRREYTDMD